MWLLLTGSFTCVIYSSQALQSHNRSYMTCTHVSVTCLCYEPSWWMYVIECVCGAQANDSGSRVAKIRTSAGNADISPPYLAVCGNIYSKIVIIKFSTIITLKPLRDPFRLCSHRHTHMHMQRMSLPGRISANPHVFISFMKSCVHTFL